MPIDARIPLSVDPPAFPDAFAGIGKGVALRDMVEQAKANARARADDQATQQTIAQAGGNLDTAIQTLYQRGLARPAMALEAVKAKRQKDAGDLLKTTLGNEASRYDVLAKGANGITDQASQDAFLQHLNQVDPQSAQMASQVLGPTYNPDNVTKAQSISLNAKESADMKHQAAIAYQESQKTAQDGVKFLSSMLAGTPPEHWDTVYQHAPSFVGPDVIKTVQGMVQTPEQAKALALGPEKQAELADKAADNARQDARNAQIVANETANLKLRGQEVGIQAGNLAVRRQEASKSPTAAQGGGKSDVQETVAGMIDGSLPPVLPGRATKEYNAIMAESHRQHFDLAKAAQDWTATQKYLGTLNGAQQTRLRQATEQVAETVPLVRSLVTEWDSAGIPYLSAANLAAAKRGAYGNKAQSLANRLDAQIADMTSELGTVYKGGNSSTDESLKLAARNLQGDWSKKAALDALDQIEQNIRYRRNSMKLGAVTGGNNRYEPNLGGGGAPAKRQNWVFDAKGQLVPQ